MFKYKKTLYTLICLVSVFLFSINIVVATDGSMDTVEKYAWGSNTGWINFGTTNGSAQVTDSALTGYIWSENFGWINLSPSQSGVVNDGTGSLSGFAWGEGLGWIDFGGVSIDSSTGHFSGQATGDNVGTITFDCTNCSVKTNWRVVVETSSGGGGGGGSIDTLNTPSSGSFKVVINGGSSESTDNTVVLDLLGSSNTDYFWLGQREDLLDAQRIFYDSSLEYNTINFNLSETEGLKKVYVKFCSTGSCSSVVSDSIFYWLPTEEPVDGVVEDVVEVEGVVEVEQIYEEKVGANKVEEWFADVGDFVEDIVEDAKDYLAKIPIVESLVSNDVLIEIKDRLAKLPIINSLLPNESGVGFGNYLARLPLIRPLSSNKSGLGFGDYLTKLPIIISLLPNESGVGFGNYLARLPLISSLISKPAGNTVTRLGWFLPSLSNPVGGTVSKLGWSLPKFLQPKIAVAPIASLEKMMPLKAPLAFGGEWRFVPTKPVRKFVFAPLPRNIEMLKEKIPQLNKTLADVGVSRFTDVSKLKAIKLAMPGLNEVMKDLNSATLNSIELAQIQTIPVAQLPIDVKEKLPTDVVFTKVMGTSIDLGGSLMLASEGRMVQKINSISGKSLHLVVKPEYPVKSIKGYIVFNSRQTQAREKSSIPLASTFKSLFFAQPVLAYDQERSVRVEEKLVMLEFEYLDPDGDGIYTADIETPIPAGEYEVITVMYFDDPQFGPKELRLITVVDPEGYVYEEIDGKEMRISGSIVSLYRLNASSMEYEEWSADKYQQQNPQITDVRGSYAFLVPPGTYALTASAPGYLDFEGKSFKVEEGRGVHFNIELKTKYWWSRAIDWRTTALLITIMMLLFNFYKDKRRDILERRKK